MLHWGCIGLCLWPARYGRNCCLLRINERAGHPNGILDRAGTDFLAIADDVMVVVEHLRIPAAHGTQSQVVTLINGIANIQWQILPKARSLASDNFES